MGISGSAGVGDGCNGGTQGVRCGRCISLRFALKLRRVWERAMRRPVLALSALALCGALHGAAMAQGIFAPPDTSVRFDRPVFTTDTTALCPQQHHIAALRRALDDNHRAAFDRAARDGACKLVGPDIRLTVVAPPGAYDPDVEVRVAGDAPAGLDGGTLPRGKVWTLKSMVRN
jgi:hypothetical protein